MTALLVQIGDKTLPLEECTWVFRAPCGCAHSVMSASTDYRTCATEDQAWEHLEPNRIQRERDRALGDTATLVSRAEAVAAIRLGCEHTPRYGRPVTPVPDGHTWATKDRARTKHLVPGTPPDEGERSSLLEPYGVKRTSLCGRSEDRWWKADRWILDDLPECLRCVAKAKEWHETHIAVGTLDGAA